MDGEEFAALLPDYSEQAQRICERIRLATQLLLPNDICYTVSIGFATASGIRRFPPCLALADEAC